MAWNNAAADACAVAICSALGVSDPATIANWKLITENLFSNLKSSASIVLPASTVVTVGSATTQTGPQAPVTLTVN
jgi:hypothetical protein